MVTVARFEGESRLEDDLEELGTVLQPLRLPAGVSVFEQGESGDRLVWISGGEVRSSARFPDGSKRVLSHAGPGDIVGEVALLTGSRRTASVTTVTPLSGWTLDRHRFEVLRWDPRQAAVAVIQRLLELTAARLRWCCSGRDSAIDAGHGPSRSALVATSRPVPMPPTDYLASLLCFQRFPAHDDVETTVGHVSARAVDRRRPHRRR